MISTNDDAFFAKLSCIARKYYEDPYLPFFLRGPSRPRSTPLIHRGYASRVLAIRKLVQRFTQAALDQGAERVQIVNLGAGFDTTFFWLSKQLSEAQLGRLRWVEVDFEQVMTKKVSLIMQSEELSRMAAIPGSAPSQTDLLLDIPHKIDQILPCITPRYCAFPADLRDLDRIHSHLLDGEIPTLDPSLPTLFVAECVMVYLEAEHGSKILSWISSHFDLAGFVCYEQILPFDRFGQMMLANLKQRGCPLLSIEAFPTLDSQVVRYKTNGFSHSHALDMITIYNRYLDEDTRKRIQQLEIFDEIEEWIMIQQHYCIVTAFTSSAVDHQLLAQAIQFS